MASSSSRSYSNYDVFLSFRGEDTRKIFVCHLYRALQQKAIHTFIDSKELEKGNNISELLKSIGNSRLSIVVLSRNYASSTWCLRELVKILECMETKKQIVVPVFYQVDPSDIRNLKRSFAEAFARHNGGDEQELEIWRSALTRVADLAGWDSRKYEDDEKLIEQIVEDAFRKLIRISSSKAGGLVGMAYHLKELQLLLDKKDENVRVVGIWGMGGLGKTTIARAVYDQIAHQFKHSCFLDNVKEGFAKKGEREMLEELLSRILEQKEPSVGILNRGSKMILESLKRKKILVVLDDVDNSFQIEALVGDVAFGDGSRIIVTTRDIQSLSEVHVIYHPQLLSDTEAVELFMKYAFRRNQSTPDYNDVIMCAIDYAQGLPLALKVLGAFLNRKTVQEWEGVLEKVKRIPHRGIQDVLRTSFDGLDDSEKDIFLDIACFFRGMNKDFVTHLLECCGFFPHSGLRVLVDRALISISDNNTFEMHDLLQEMGREVVRQECIKEPGARSRLWNYEDVDRTLTQNTATQAVEGIILDLSESNINQGINVGAFVRMTKLRILMIYHPLFSSYDHNDRGTSCDGELKDVSQQHTTVDLDFLSHELRILMWHGCPLTVLPSNFNPKNLVKLDMHNSHLLQLWEGIKHLKKLKVLILSNCRYLVKIPDLTEATNLGNLVLDGCSSLLEVHSSISTLQYLESFSLKGCKKLKIIPVSRIDMKSLKTLNLSGCSSLEKFPKISNATRKLSYLELDGTGIKELPSSINNLTGLVTLNLRCCSALQTLPESICLKSLETLDLSGCSNLEKFPEITKVMKKLSKLHLDESGIKELPPSINNLTGLVALNLEGCSQLKSLPRSLHLRSLQTLSISGCSNLETFPEISEVMTELSELHLNESGIRELPSSINNLTGLVTLNLKDCRALTSLPDSLRLKSLKTLNLSGCSNFENFEDISSIECLKELDMRNCTSLLCLPASICNLAHLTHLYLSGCSKLHSLPENIGNLKSLQVFEVQGSGIAQLPFGILRLINLNRFSCIGCKQLVTPFSSWIPSIEEYHSYSSMVHLDLSDCNLLELSDGIAHLCSLETLKLCRNNDLKSLPSVMNRLGCLAHLKLEACKNLISIPQLSESIISIDAHDCIALETVSMPKPPFQTNFCFTFSNCMQLARTTTNLFRDMVETHFDYKDFCLLRFTGGMFLPGSEVPYWFDHQEMGSSVTAQLPPTWLDKKFFGFAIGVVVANFIGAPYDATELSAVCTFRGSHGIHISNFQLPKWQFLLDRFLDSDHILLGYFPWSEYGENANIYTEVTVKVVLTNRGEYKHHITRCGLHFFQSMEMAEQGEGVLVPVSSLEKWTEMQRKKNEYWESRFRPTLIVHGSRHFDLQNGEPHVHQLDL